MYIGVIQMRKILTIAFLGFMALFIGFSDVRAEYLNEVDNFNNIVVFIRFKDETDYVAPYSIEYYEDMFNGEDVISLRDYYLEATYDQLTINSFIVSENDTIVFYTDLYDRAYYEAYDSVDNPSGYHDGEEAQREHELIKRAVDYVDANNLVPDELELDVNDDGQMDSITFMVSGEDSGWNTILWPHKWELYTYYDYNYGFTGTAPSINGVSPLTYTFELLGDDQNYDYQVDVGVLAHETFHLLSAPDLYHYYDYLNVTPVGEWGLMEYNGNVPSHMLGYMKYMYGNWIDTVTELDKSGTYTLYPLQDSPDNIFKIYTGVGNEWIYLEYRDHDGLYESNLPDTGLLVYRVNRDLEGNESGSYDDDGNPTDEVFIFRPGMDDTIPPIILEETEDSYIDGRIEDATLSQTNDYDEIGLGTSFHIFSSEGDILNIGIYNVVEHSGYVTFDLFLEPDISLDTNGVDIGENNIMLYDSHLMEYLVTINNLPEDLNAYYTLDGTIPSFFGTPYTGGPLEITAENNIVTVALYDGVSFISSTSKEYTFSDKIESDHNPYGDLLEMYWYLDFDNSTTYLLDFDSNSELEDEYDYVFIIDDTIMESYTGSELVLYEEVLTNEYLVIKLETDDYVSDFFGFEAFITPIDDISLNVIGSNDLTHTVGTDYTDLGYSVNGSDVEDYTIEVLGLVDDMVLGDYTITYNVLNNLNEIVITKTRTVHVVDDIAPEVALNGEDYVYIEAGSDYIDEYITFSDNFDNDLTVDVTGSIDTSRLEIKVFTYTVTDDSGNETIVRRTVEVVDTVSPTLTLNPSVDTIYVGQEWLDFGVGVTDNLGINFDVIRDNDLDNLVAGTYTISYTVSDSSNNESTIIRYITVLEQPEIYDIVCSDFLATLEEGSDIQYPGCTVNGTKMDVEYVTTAPSGPGTYAIENKLIVDGVTYIKVQYIQIVRYDSLYRTVAYIEKKEEELI